MTDTYMLPDGSPRFGVRTAEPEATAAAPGSSTRDPHTVAREADGLDALELETALQFRYRLGSRTADQALIDGLRTAHPEELRAAEEIVKGVLVSPREWWSLAKKDRMEQLTKDWERQGGAGPKVLAPMVGRLVLSLLPVAVWLLALVVHIDDSLAFCTMIAATFAIAPYQRRLERRTRGLLPPKIHPEDLAMLWDDAVNATLADILDQVPGAGAAALSAARRAWRHNMSAAEKARELAYK